MDSSSVNISSNNNSALSNSQKPNMLPIDQASMANQQPSSTSANSVDMMSTTTSTTVPKLTPEQEEEIKLRAKYPNPQKPGGSSFIQKMMHKGSKKYFDSGDYNMAKSKNKAALSKQNPSSLQQQNVAEVTSPSSVDPPTSMITSQDAPSASSSSSSTASSASNNPSVSLSEASNSSNTNNTNSLMSSTTTPSNPLSGNRNLSYDMKATTSDTATTPTITINTQNQTQNILNTNNSTAAAATLSSNNTNLSDTNNPSAMNHQWNNAISPSVSLNSHHVPLQQQHQHSQHQGMASAHPNTLSSSISASSMNQMLSSSMSTDKLTNFQLNTDPTALLDTDEIGHGIPTPECLPQSRKHSIVQSKLATPTLSSS